MTTDHALAVAGGVLGGVLTALVARVLEHRLLNHLCRNPPCVNPWHLDPVTPQINSRHGIAGEVNGARQRGVTHCPKGHAYDDSNTQVRPTGARRCRACAREYARVYRRRLA
jgi:hypothetical protein